MSQVQRGALRDYVLNVEPGAQVLVQCIGDYFRVLDASGGKVNISTSKGDAFDVQEGEGARVREFESLRVRNDAGVTLRVRMIVGSGEFESGRTTGNVSLKAAATIQAVGDVAGGGTIPANPDRRQLVMRASLNNAAAVTIAGLPIEPGDTFELDVAGEVAVGGDAGDVLHVAEVV
ncbi:hypothetical protein [Billgrantia bachuensis]|uniref:Uncharacterized protein n=1 Tax=Billgrantia bachuensis TaxID=2717286 RepID=A0ABX0PP75_9GAMM|nr:hypothetical protein [Halomonas bachuensis]NIC03972.1 hypothetical protein [Halomonas bachuensis]